MSAVTNTEVRNALTIMRDAKVHKKVLILAGIDANGLGYVSMYIDGRHSSSVSSISDLTRIDLAVDEFEHRWVGSYANVDSVYLAGRSPLIGGWA